MSITKVPQNDHLQFVNSLELQPLHCSFLFVFTWIFLRIFFEGVLEFYHRIGYGAFSYETVLTYFIHSPLFYLNLFFILVIIISLITREEIQRVTAVASVGLGILLFVPILDWFIGGGYLITYPLRIDVCLVNYLNPFISLAHIGISPGQRITVVLTALLIMFYALIKTKKIFIGFLLLLCTLLIIPVWGGLTTIVAGNRPEDIYLTGGILYTDGQKYAAILAYNLFFFPYYIAIC